MTMAHSLEARFLRLVDILFARWPQVRPPAHRLEDAKIIAHRGIHDNRRIPENTLAAFECAAEAGIWGVELDVRWTKDEAPVVCHDPDLERVFGIRRQVHTMRLEELRRRCPLIPSLTEVVTAFGGRLHLMIELKQPRAAAPAYPHQRLAQCLAPLKPVHDYHLMALSPELLEANSWGPEVCLLIARLELSKFSRVAIERGYAGFCGHYALVRRRLLTRHKLQGQRVGTGFIASRACLYRELNRGVAWLFSNHAAAMQRLCREALNSGPPKKR
jgi:glycerophosphoryl diester phosphodiesterase